MPYIGWMVMSGGGWIPPYVWWGPLEIGAVSTHRSRAEAEEALAQYIRNGGRQ